MPADPLREKYIKQLIGQLRGVEVAEGQRLIIKWMAEERITREELVAPLTAPMNERHSLADPLPPSKIGSGGWG